jgi:hypothetical protein
MMFEGRVFDPQRCLLGTNAVKTYLPETEGKDAEQLTAAHLAQHELQWRDVLQLLAGAGDAPPRRNRIALDLAGKPHDLLLARLMHPARRSKMMAHRTQRVSRTRWC